MVSYFLPKCFGHTFKNSNLNNDKNDDISNGNLDTAILYKLYVLVALRLRYVLLGYTELDAGSLYNTDKTSDMPGVRPVIVIIFTVHPCARACRHVHPSTDGCNRTKAREAEEALPWRRICCCSGRPSSGGIQNVWVERNQQAVILVDTTTPAQPLPSRCVCERRRRLCYDRCHPFDGAAARRRHSRGISYFFLSANHAVDWQLTWREYQLVTASRIDV